MRIKVPVHCKKGNLTFTEPLVVDRVRGNAVRVNNKHWWNVSKIVRNTKKCIRNDLQHEQSGQSEPSFSGDSSVQFAEEQ